MNERVGERGKEGRNEIEREKAREGKRERWFKNACLSFWRNFHTTFLEVKPHSCSPEPVLQVLVHILCPINLGHQVLTELYQFGLYSHSYIMYLYGHWLDSSFLISCYSPVYILFLLSFLCLLKMKTGSYSYHALKRVEALLLLFPR